MTEMSEMHLFVVWDKGRRIAGSRILADIAKRFEVVFAGEMSFPCAAADAYCRFYGSDDVELRRKVGYCGGGPFLLAVVRTRELSRLVDQDGKLVNALMFSSKKTYRRWCGGYYRVYGTLQPAEFERDIFRLTGHTAEEWANGVPADVHMELPPLGPAPRDAGEAPGPRSMPVCKAGPPKGWLRVTLLPGARVGMGAVVQNGTVVSGEVPPCSACGGFPARIRRGADSEARNSVFDAVESLTGVEGLSVIVDRRQGLVHRCVLSGTWRGRPCVVKWTDNDSESLAGEYEVGSAFYTASGGLSPEMYDFRRDGERTAVVMERMSGVSLGEYERSHGGNASEMREMALQVDGIFAAMRRIGMCHRDLHPDNVFVCDDGRAKLFDFQNSALASRRSDALSRALRTSRAYIYEYRSVHQPVIGLFNDREHILLRLPAGGALRRELESMWAGRTQEADYYCPVGLRRAVGFALRSVGVLLRYWLVRPHGKVIEKLRDKLAVTGPTLRYWLRNGVSGPAGFVHGGRARPPKGDVRR